MKRKWISILLVLCLAVSAAGCSAESGENHVTTGGYSDKTVRLDVDDLPASDLGDGFCFVGEEMGLTDVSARFARAMPSNRTPASHTKGAVLPNSSFMHYACTPFFRSKSKTTSGLLHVIRYAPTAMA